MGGSYYDTNSYTARIDSHKKSGTSYFDYSTRIKSGKIAAKVHEKLDPSKLNKAGKNIRESLDSKDNPVSTAIAVLFDVTGSMKTIPQLFVSKLDKLMTGLVKKGYLEYPHVLFGAIGDAKCDHVPLQIGQFESGNETDEVLSLIHLEGGGGGQQTESYELAMYFMARHTQMDCLDKRGKKGYLFLSGDELSYGKVDKEEVKSIIGDTIESDIPTKQILEELKQKFEVFWILPQNSSYFNDTKIRDGLKEMFGQRLLLLEEPENICELIIATIGLNEGCDIDSISKDLKSLGADSKAITSTARSLEKFKPGGIVKTVKGSIDIKKVDNNIERL